MAATIIDGKAIAASVRQEVARGVRELTAQTGQPPGLATVLVGDDAASAIYIASKRKLSSEVGMADLHQHLPAESTHAQVAETLQALNEDPAVSGILLQLPVPKHLDGPSLTELIAAAKDVDGLTPVSAGKLIQGAPGLRPCTPAGIMELLDHHQVELEGARAVVVGRSMLVGKPVAHLLLHGNATVTICHSRTQDLASVTSEADVLIAAVGVPGLIGAEHVKPGATVIDVGMNRLESGLAGDVDFDAAVQKAGLITPVPGGVGPMTVAMLLANTLSAARTQSGMAA
jgi:methylenetetrahydrofolate dehydrogenase (NADP+)/methenyltetrahydrofolate cyclohydrolase